MIITIEYFLNPYFRLSLVETKQDKKKKETRIHLLDVLFKLRIMEKL